MSYIDGFVAAVPNDKKQEFLDHSRIAGAVFKRYGALKTVENWGDDVPMGEVTSFPQAVQCKDTETVVFSWVVWPSKDVRDAGWAKIMEDPEMSPDANPMPFDGKRLIFGGFETLLET
ncbi:hypothetical protein So717_21410 [Roseobacter cerasinus]|uniref:RNA signal recognition particle 4.5S RNA n=1 Tax=Roseobacter cerasinus TaxID=2602289 RepID=A0A640VPM8_9RHOB|nr:DUF1428 domain-containing protein [Roseobacter cerasinus]GFE50388.1 hypothetical protein So717_21410 [Roseobacter cerasinus]